jgi:hypothetical protein
MIILYDVFIFKNAPYTPFGTDEKERIVARIQSGSALVGFAAGGNTARCQYVSHVLFSSLTVLTGSASSEN